MLLPGRVWDRPLSLQRFYKASNFPTIMFSCTWKTGCCLFFHQLSNFAPNTSHSCLKMVHCVFHVCRILHWKHRFLCLTCCASLQRFKPTQPLNQNNPKTSPKEPMTLALLKIYLLALHWTCLFGVVFSRFVCLFSSNVILRLRPSTTL